MSSPPGVRISRVHLALGLLLLLGCGGGDSAGPSRDIDGNWRGSASTQAFNFFADVTIADAGGSLTGNGSFSGSQNCNSIGLSGSRSGSNVSFSMTCIGFIPINFSGRLSSAGNSMTGTISGSGFSATPLDFIKQ